MTVAFAPKKSKFEGPSKEPAEPNKGLEAHESGDNVDGTEEDVSHIPIHEVAEMHGPAKHVNIMHDEAVHHTGEHEVGHTGEGKIHVHTTHGEEDHQVHHHSYHEDPHAAMEHAKMAMGLGQHTGKENQELKHEGRHAGMVKEHMKDSVPGYEG